LFSGDLNDPFSEFFVAVDPELAHLHYMHQSPGGHLAGDGGFGGLGEAEDLSNEREGGMKLWESKYRFHKTMLPAFVGEAFGRKARFEESFISFAANAHDSIDFLHRQELELYPLQLSRQRLGGNSGEAQ
jgi:gamma-tubulin complex component 3